MAGTVGYVWRADGDVFKNVLVGKVNKSINKRPLDRPKTKWKDTVEKDMKLINGNVTLEWT